MHYSCFRLWFWFTGIVYEGLFGLIWLRLRFVVFVNGVGCLCLLCCRRLVLLFCGGLRVAGLGLQVALLIAVVIGCVALAFVV